MSDIIRKILLVLLLVLLAFSFFDLDVSMGISRKIVVVLTVVVAFGIIYLDNKGGGKKGKKK
ncbi:hypothetical protein HPY28_10765 [Brevibacillus sp. HB1.2]|uniref:hypothetical protein n=1 Tax=unclassified Brevibacillus TaxID=2684853 RepID=UPI000375DC1A|nr:MULTISPECIES: hypothetical protein [unclassified Brevibacillus]ATF12494.1 hypothetical protein A616_10940 [Brevibacillus brevis X23]NTU20796.1 hypothetical protein [Brevibacillus sp. HB1.2]NTU32540.1 hypothetical protein [Brevibacillus sp. HB1.1]